jgi:hypothetical protein
VRIPERQTLNEADDRERYLMSKIASLGVVTTLVAVALAITPARANLVQDPSFASGFGASWTAAPGWNIDHTNPAPGDSQDATNFCFGSSCVDYGDVDAASYLTQTLNTVVGAVYTLTFDFADGPADASNPAELVVLWGSDIGLNEAGDVAFDETYLDLTTGYSQYTVSGLVATSTSTQLTFLAEQVESFDNLDDVDVEVPEPTSLSLLGFGLVALGLVRRRKNG